jgi:hypothetical protein
VPTLGIATRCLQIVKGPGVGLFLIWVAGFLFFVEHVVANTPLHLLAGGGECLTLVDRLFFAGALLCGIGHVAEGRRDPNRDQTRPQA